jgi:hypothetical protein
VGQNLLKNKGITDSIPEGRIVVSVLLGVFCGEKPNASSLKSKAASQQE